MEPKSISRIVQNLETSAKKIERLSRSIPVPYTLNSAEVELIVRVFRSVKFKSLNDLGIARSILVKLGDINEQKTT